MDVLSAATEEVANADAIAAAAATLSVAAAAAAAAGTSSTSSSPRPSSPANSTSTKDGLGGGGGCGSRAEGSEMDEDDTPYSRSRESSSATAPVIPPAVVIAAAPGISPAQREAHAKLEAQADDIRSGKHPKMEAEMRAQGGLKQCRLEISEENRLLLKNNIEQLNKAEHRDSDVQTKVALERTQEELLDDVHQRIRKAKVDGGLVPAKTANGIGAEAIGGQAGAEADKAGTQMLLGRKRARLMPARTFEKVTAEAVLAKAEARRVRTVTLSDIEMRRDFRAIITDWRERAAKYLSTYNNSHWTKVNVSPDSFRVRGVTFAKGDPVVVTSRVTGEEFHGEITVVKPKAVFLSLYGGVKTRIFMDHISTGRLTVAKADSKSIQ